MSSSNCCFLTCIEVSQEAGQVVWYSHLFQNFPQFIVIHTVQRKPFNITVIQVYALTNNTEEAEVEGFYEDLQDLLELTPKKDILFIIGLECKSRMSRNTWRNRQIWPWSAEWSRAKSNRVLPGEQTGHNKQLLQTTPEKTLHIDITRWSIQKSDWLYSLQPKMEKLCTVSKWAQIMNFLLPNSDLNWRKYGKPLDHLDMT